MTGAARCSIGAALTFALALSAGPAQAQQPSEWTAAISAGPFADFPTDFLGSCSERAGGIVGSVTRRLGRGLSLEGSVMGTQGISGAVCVLGLFAPPAPGTVYTRTAIPSEIEGTGFAGTFLGALVEPWPERRVSPRARIGIGRLLGKGLTSHRLSGGLGVRIGGGRVVLEADRLGFGYDATLTTLLETTSGPTVVDREVIRLTNATYLFRLGWEFGVG